MVASRYLSPPCVSKGYSNLFVLAFASPRMGAWSGFGYRHLRRDKTKRELRSDCRWLLGSFEALFNR